MAVSIRPAVLAELGPLHDLVERAYRGETAKKGWTHEADLLFDARTDKETLTAILASPSEVLLAIFEDEAPIGCVNVADRGDGLAYLGLLCIDPERQGAHLGRTLLSAAEDHARGHFGSTRIEMTVIEQRRELIAYYERRGWRITGERRDFPVPLDPPFFMTVLEKSLV